MLGKWEAERSPEKTVVPFSVSVTLPAEKGRRMTPPNVDLEGGQLRPERELELGVSEPLEANHAPSLAQTYEREEPPPVRLPFVDLNGREEQLGPIRDLDEASFPVTVRDRILALMNKVPFIPLGLLWPLYNATYGFVDFGRACKELDVYPESGEKMIETLGLRYGGIRVFKAQSSHFKEGYSPFVSREITRLDKEVSPFLWNRIHSLLPKDSVVGLESLVDLYNEVWPKEALTLAQLNEHMWRCHELCCGQKFAYKKAKLGCKLPNVGNGPVFVNPPADRPSSNNQQPDGFGQDQGERHRDSSRDRDRSRDSGRPGGPPRRAWTPPESRSPENPHHGHQRPGRPYPHPLNRKHTSPPRAPGPIRVVERGSASRGRSPEGERTSPFRTLIDGDAPIEALFDALDPTRTGAYSPVSLESSREASWSLESSAESVRDYSLERTTPSRPLGDFKVSLARAAYEVMTFGKLEVIDRFDFGTLF